MTTALPHSANNHTHTRKVRSSSKTWTGQGSPGHHCVRPRGENAWLGPGEELYLRRFWRAPIESQRASNSRHPVSRNSVPNRRFRVVRRTELEQTGTISRVFERYTSDPSDFTLSSAAAMSHDNADPKPPPKLRLGDAKPTSSGLKIVTIAPRSGTQHQVPPSEPSGGRLRPPPPPVRRPTPPEAAAPPKPPLAGEERELPTPVGDPYLGCTIDKRYKVEALLGEGGMGVVYRCRHKIIDKQVALKILRADLARDKEVTERFLIEAKAASSIGNDHIIDISDFGQLPDGSAYFVMEFLEGVPLAAAISPGMRMPAERIVHIAMQLCDGLAAAHAAGIVHRDLKPDNIYLVPRGLEKDYIKILDFGIAKVTNQATGKLTQAGSIFGTPHYMSPEQAAGAPVDHTGDIYSLGVILYELSSGRVPFDADNFMGILTQHMYKAPERITNPSEGQGVPPGLEAIILKCMSKRPEQRYQSMLELREDLQRLRENAVPNAVEELVARADGFNVPADFFAPSQPVVATDLDLTFAKKPSRKWLWLFALVPAAAAAGGLLFNRTPASPPRAAGAAVAKATNTTTRQVAPSAALRATPTRQVVIGIEPAEAHAFSGNHDLGANPIVVNVPEGETMTLEVRHSGYHSETLVLTGDEEKLAVSLERKRAKWRPAKAHKPGQKRTVKAAGAGSKGSAIDNGEIVNPWD